MRNLKLQYVKLLPGTLPAVKFLVLNPNEGTDVDVIYLATENKVFAFNIFSKSLEQLAEFPDIVGLEYLAMGDTICVATHSGEVALVNLPSKALTEAAFCEVGIERMAWSPDQEVVVFVTRVQHVVVMTCTYETVFEHPLADVLPESNPFVTVGWGKEETQFRGSEGKLRAREQPQPATHLEESLKGSEISWRGDAAYFAISFWNPKIGRVIKIFDKEGVPKYTTQLLAELHPPIAWRPSGAWLAAPLKMPNKSAVVLLEKNCLRHHEIGLPFSLETEIIQSLKWSCDSDILCLEVKNKTTSLNSLYLYTISNYHWYLKQVLSFKSENTISVYNWDNRMGEEKTLHILLENGDYLVYRWHFDIDRHPLGVVAVIDGNKLLLTDFCSKVIPPPMCDQELKIETYLNDCTFISIGGEELWLLAYDLQQNLHIFKKSMKTTASGKLRIHFKKAFTQRPAIDLCKLGPLANISWLKGQSVIATSTLENSTKVFLISVDEPSESYSIQSSLNLEGTVDGLSRRSTEGFKIFAHTTNGRIQTICLTEQGTLKLEEPHMSLNPLASARMESFAFPQYQELVMLRRNQSLYINAECIASDVTSFCLAGHYLAFTKLTAIYFMRLSDHKIVSERKIERGGKLIIIIGKDSRTVLQLPRGNLEAICPRVLTLEIVATLLEERLYYLAMHLLRKQRINLNLICDHNMLSFVDHLKIFLEDIQNPQWLALFLSELKNEDFTTTMYASNYIPGCQDFPHDFKIEQKVVYLCTKLCELMEQNFEPRFRLPIITAYVKIGKIEKALDVIWQEKQRISADDEEGDQADEALKYLLYLVDINELYNIALGTYNFALVLFVAQKSHKDPREYLPFLNELKEMDPNYRRFKIDEHLKRNEKAIRNLAQCGESKINEAIIFIKQHALFQEALTVYKDQENCYRMICREYADYLREKGKLENASIMYERSNELSQALICAKNALDWKRTLVLAKRDGRSVQDVALSLVPALGENGMHLAAFEILKTYGNNNLEAIKCLIRAKLYSRAIFEAQLMSDDGDLINCLIKPGLLVYASLLESSLCADKEMFIDYKQRLLKLRQKSKQQKDLDDGEDLYEFDLISDTTSVNSSRHPGSSRNTSKTFRSSKNRRKHERKLLSLKPGSPFEDIALIDALHNHITKVYSQRQYIRDICKALIEVREDAVARIIQHLLKQLLTIMKDSLDEIWIPEMTTQNTVIGQNVDLTQLLNEQRYALMNTEKRFKPQLVSIDWEHEILR